ncbi:MAG: hypothetical protein J6M21_01585 [Campylobacter sp.]|nr:hypothetical protein [Campylobacter sp.]
MKILALYGGANHGKTNSIIQTYNDLINFGARIIWYQPRTNNLDFLAILDYQKKIITINSAGDSATEVINGLNQIENELNRLNLKADCHICATRTKGGSITALNNHFAPIEPIWLDSLNLDSLKSTNNFQNVLNSYYNFQSLRIISHI